MCSYSPNLERFKGKYSEHLANQIYYKSTLKSQNNNGIDVDRVVKVFKINEPVFAAL